MSAYDMAVSDAIYGPSDRYVSRQRLRAMLQHEYDLLLKRLGSKEGDKRNRLRVKADRVQFLGAPRGAGNGDAAEEEASAASRQPPRRPDTPKARSF